MDYLDRKKVYQKLSAQPPFQTSNPISSGLRFLVCDNQNQNQQTEMLKKGVNSANETRKWASATLDWSLNPWISCAWSILSKGTLPPLPPSLIFMASLPRYQKTYLLCTISLEYSVSRRSIGGLKRTHTLVDKSRLMPVCNLTSQTKNPCEPLVAVWLRPSTTKPCICCKQVAEKPHGEHLKMMYVVQLWKNPKISQNFKKSLKIVT